MHTTAPIKGAAMSGFAGLQRCQSPDTRGVAPSSCAPSFVLSTSVSIHRLGPSKPQHIIVRPY
ncbi:hypothetical protein TSMEX_004001 [Taenia solium]|eukprot:TsM_000407400 transcript=TsM_000407400 gene=TsM_000407400